MMPSAEAARYTSCLSLVSAGLMRRSTGYRCARRSADDLLARVNFRAETAQYAPQQGRFRQRTGYQEPLDILQP